MINHPTYLVRPNDWSLFELDPSNGCYRHYPPRKRCDGTSINAQPHFTYDNLVQNYGFYPIEKSEIPKYQKKSNEHYDFIVWQSRPDGHGGLKGGTYSEYLEYKQRVEQYNKIKE